MPPDPDDSHGRDRHPTPQVGSLLGGFLADPVGSHPTWFEDGGALREFFVKFPYCLPCIACSLIGFVAFTVGFFFFAETAPHIIEAQRKRKESLLASETQSLLHGDATATAKREVDDAQPTTPTPAPSNEKKLTVLGSFTDRSTLSAIVAYGLTAFTAIMHDEVRTICCVHTCVRACACVHSPRNGAVVKLTCASVRAHATPKLYVIWAVAEISHGGLAFSSGQVGTTLMIAGFWLIFAQVRVVSRISYLGSTLGTIACALIGVAQAFLYPFLARFLGAKYIWRTMALILAPIVALFPTLSLLAKRDLTVLLWVLLLALMAARIVAVQCLFTPSMLFVNNSATAANIGTVNGVGQVRDRDRLRAATTARVAHVSYRHQMVGSASRTAGPFLAGALWSLSGNSFGFGGRVVFFFVASMGIVMFAWSFVLPDSINRKRTDNDDKGDSSTLPAASVVVAAE